MPDDPAQPPLEVLLERAGAAVARHRRRAAAAHGLSPTAMAVLAALDGGADAFADVAGGRDRAGPGDPASATAPATAPASTTAPAPGPGTAPSHRELAGRLGLSPATLTPVLDALEAAGEVRRERDRTDRRVVRLHRTSAARARRTAVPPARLPRPDPQLDAAIRAWLRAVLAATGPPG